MGGGRKIYEGRIEKNEIEGQLEEQWIRADAQKDHAIKQSQESIILQPELSVQVPKFAKTTGYDIDISQIDPSQNR